MKINNYWLINSETKTNTRDKNQDYVGYKTNKFNDYLAIVCDGIGSLDKSEWASKIAVQTFLNAFSEDKKIKDVSKWFDKTLQKAFLNVQKFSDEKLYAENIGTTLVVSLNISNKNYIFNIGDSRAYLIREYQVKQLSVDHNYYNALIKAGRKNELEHERSKWGCITNFIDCRSFDSAQYDVMAFAQREDDYILICTDGLYNFVDAMIIIDTIYDDEKTNEQKIKCLVEKAIENKSNDNVSGILIKKA